MVQRSFTSDVITTPSLALAVRRQLGANEIQSIANAMILNIVTCNFLTETSEYKPDDLHLS